jgi:hypothetical protein
VVDNIPVSLLTTHSLFYGVVQKNDFKKTGSSSNDTITSKIRKVSIMVHNVACNATTARQPNRSDTLSGNCSVNTFP